MRVLGPVQAVTTAGRSVDLASASQRRLVALLAAEAPRSVRAQQIQDVLAVSPSALRTTVSRVRRVLGTDAIAGPPGHYRLGVPVDATRFANALFNVGATDDRAGELRALRLLTEAEEIATDRKLPNLQADIDRIRTEAPLTRT